MREGRWKDDGSGRSGGTPHTMYVCPVDHISILVKSQDVIPHTRGPPGFNLMLVPEQFLSGHSPPIVQLPMGEHP